jgi:hypothetical protein
MGEKEDLMDSLKNAFFHPPDQGCQMVYFQIKIQIWVPYGGPRNGKG